MSIDHINLSRVDLNLLVALDALLTDRSVTRAAARVGLRQSAMSHNLARLRALLGDELLTRGPEGMRPTPRALALTDPVRIALAQITSLVFPNLAFDPRTAERAFRIGLPDGAEVLLGPALISYLRETAPGIRLRLHYPDRLFDELDADRLDFGIAFGRLPEGQVHHKQRRLGTDRFVCIFNADRIGLSSPISLDDYLRLPHVLTTIGRDEQGVVDEALAKLGLGRTVVVTTPRFAAVPFLVAGAPLVATMPANIAHFFAARLGLSVSPVPVELPEAVASLVWHASYDHDPANKWLRQTVMRVAVDLGWRPGAA